MDNKEKIENRERIKMPNGVRDFISNRQTAGSMIRTV